MPVCRRVHHVDESFCLPTIFQCNTRTERNHHTWQLVEVDSGASDRRPLGPLGGSAEALFVALFAVVHNPIAAQRQHAVRPTTRAWRIRVCRSIVTLLVASPGTIATDTALCLVQRHCDRDRVDVQAGNGELLELVHIVKQPREDRLAVLEERCPYPPTLIRASFRHPVQADSFATSAANRVNLVHPRLQHIQRTGQRILRKPTRPPADLGQESGHAVSSATGFPTTSVARRARKLA